MSKRDLYYMLTTKHFNLGLLREIYSNDSVSICNLANSMYLAVPFDAIESNTPVGVVVDIQMVEKIIENNNYIYNIVNAYATQNQKKYILPIGDKLIDVFLPIMKKESGIGNESPDIDLQWEQELMSKNKSR